MIRFLLLTALLGHSLVAVAAETGEASSELQAHPDPVMEKLIQRIEEEERRYDCMEVTLQRSTEYLNKKWTIPKSVETIRTVRQPDLLFAERNRVDHILDGSKRTDRSVVFFNGKTTTAIEYGNSVNVLHYRYEPAFVFPPHTWAIFHLEVNFPLSIYLRGTAAIKSCQKVRRLPRPTGSIFEFNFVESEYLGEVDFDGLRCEKVKVLKRNNEKDPPTIYLLWLAKEHNYVCVKSQTLATINGVDHAWTESKIDALRELDEGLFVPQKVTVERYDFQGFPEGKKKVDTKFTLLVKSANAAPKYTGEELAPDAPEGIPTYEISADHRLLNSPHHPKPTGEPPSTSLKEIVAAIRNAEKKYQKIDISLFEDYRHLRRKNTYTENGFISTLRSKTESRTITSLERHRYFEDKINFGDDGISRRYQKTHLYDGKIARSSNAGNGENLESLAIEVASVSFTEEPNLDAIRPHMMLFRSLRDYRPLSKVLDSNWYSHKKSYPVNIAYVGEELIEGELCHKIRRNLVSRKGEIYQQHFIWIAPGKSYMPIRVEWKDRRKSLSLPSSVHVVTSWKELASDVWMPMKVRLAPFQWSSAIGMSEGRLIHKWQRDMTVKSVTLTPKVDDKLFSELTFPAGTDIYFRGVDGKSLGPITQLKAGPFEFSEEQFHELKGK